MPGREGFSHGLEPFLLGEGKHSIPQGPEWVREN